MGRIAPALLTAALAACGRPSQEEPKSALETEVSGLSAAAPCARRIPLEWSPSWPVPERRGKDQVYRVFFYGRDGSPSLGFTAHEPEGEAVLARDGRALECRRLPIEGKAIPGADMLLKGTTLEEITRQSSRLYVLTERLAALYATGGGLGAEERALAAEFSDLFSRLALPAHAAAYRALSPGFWDWLAGNGGRAPSSELRPAR